MNRSTFLKSLAACAVAPVVAAKALARKPDGYCTITPTHYTATFAFSRQGFAWASRPIVTPKVGDLVEIRSVL